MNDRENIDTVPSHIYIGTTYAHIRTLLVKALKVSMTKRQWLCSDTLELIGVLQASQHSNSLHIRCRLANVFRKPALTLQFRQQYFHIK